MKISENPPCQAIYMILLDFVGYISIYFTTFSWGYCGISLTIYRFIGNGSVLNMKNIKLVGGFLYIYIRMFYFLSSTIEMEFRGG